ncbi:hypothetical protein [Halobacterium zhouii]|uniref:hypothetical protein n=1 Tax=Halobacterium zhouii TaxID=2902624 RepID=UPI001E33DBB8|nr:hypothetical protein [Halobacterium zhouii]
MPSKRREFTNLAQYVFARFVWLFLARNPRGGAYAELKRLRITEWVVLLIPFGMLVSAGVWLHLFLPRKLVPLAGAVMGLSLLVGVALAASTVVLAWLVDWHHYYL